MQNTCRNNRFLIQKNLSEAGLGPGLQPTPVDGGPALLHMEGERQATHAYTHNCTFFFFLHSCAFIFLVCCICINQSGNKPPTADSFFTVWCCVQGGAERGGFLRSVGGERGGGEERESQLIESAG